MSADEFQNKERDPDVMFELSMREPKPGSDKARVDLWCRTGLSRDEFVHLMVDLTAAFSSGEAKRVG